jgi:hypothetical protein
LLTILDLAFASSSIITREVAGSEFRYAKIMTMPFFGSGIVELPPEGYKRAKNSRKMQMCFFVHEGKVMVEIGAQAQGEMNQFAISKGGVWVVPRGKLHHFLFSFPLPSPISVDNALPKTSPLDHGRRLHPLLEAKRAVTHRLRKEYHHCPALWLSRWRCMV